MFFRASEYLVRLYCENWGKRRATGKSRDGQEKTGWTSDEVLRIWALADTCYIE